MKTGAEAVSRDKSRLITPDLTSANPPLPFTRTDFPVTDLITVASYAPTFIIVRIFMQPHCIRQNSPRGSQKLPDTVHTLQKSRLAQR